MMLQKWKNAKLSQGKLERKLATISKIFISKDWDSSADSNYTKKKKKNNRGILSLPHLFPFYPSRKKKSTQRLYQTCQNKRIFLHMSTSSINCCHCRKCSIKFHMDNKHFLYLTLISSLSFFLLIPQPRKEECKARQRDESLSEHIVFDLADD